MNVKSARAAVENLPANTREVPLHIKDHVIIAFLDNKVFDLTPSGGRRFVDLPTSGGRKVFDPTPNGGRKIRAITSQITNIVLDTDNVESKIVRQKIAELEETTPKPKKKKRTKIKS